MLLGFKELVYNEVMVLEGFSKVLLDLLFSYSSEVLKQLVNGRCKELQKLVKTCWMGGGGDVIGSAKSRGKQVDGDVAKAAADKGMTGRGRKQGIKRPAQGKTAIRTQSAKLKTSNKLAISQSGMETIHQDSCLCEKSELDLFSTPPTQVEMEKGF